jgi:hypothetical protein
MIVANNSFFKVPKYLLALVFMSFAASVLVPPKPAAARDRGGAIAGAIIGGVAAAIIAGQIARSAARSDVPPPARRVRSSKRKAPAEQASAAMEETGGKDPFAGVTPNRIVPVSENLSH